MNCELIIESLKNIPLMIAFGVLDKDGNVLDCRVTGTFPKEKLRDIYAKELNILHTTQSVFGGLKYRLLAFEKMSQILYVYDECYIVASSANPPELLLKYVENAIKDVEAHKLQVNQ